MLLSVRNSGIPLRPWQVVLAEWGHLVWRGMYQPQAERCPSRRSWIRSPHHPPQPRDQLEWCRVFLYAENSCIVRVITQIAKYSIRFFFFSLTSKIRIFMFLKKHAFHSASLSSALTSLASVALPSGALGNSSCTSPFISWLLNHSPFERFLLH